MSASVAQLDLGELRPDDPDPIGLSFSRFMREQSEVFEELVEIVRELKALGETRVSMKFVVEIARYKQIVRRHAGEPYAINNSFTSRLARAIEKTHPELSGLFVTRELRR